MNHSSGVSSVAGEAPHGLASPPAGCGELLHQFFDYQAAARPVALAVLDGRNPPPTVRFEEVMPLVTSSRGLCFVAVPPRLDA